MANFAYAASGPNGYDPTRGLFFDHLLPFMTYMYQHNDDGTSDLYVTNQLSYIFQALTGATGVTASPGDGALDGWMKAP